MLLKIFTIAAVAYGVIVLLVFLFQERMIYFPQMGREIDARPDSRGLVYETLRLSAEDGETIAAWWVQSPAGVPMRGAVLLFHGNAGNISHRIDYLAMFAKLGYPTLIIDYRGYGESSGKPSEQGTYRDAQAAWRWLTQTRGIKPSDIVIFGESLGGGPATWLAARENVRALVLASTFTSVPDLATQIYPFLPVRWIARIRYDNLSNLAKVRAPILIAHSPQDEVIPYAHGRRLFDAAREPKAFIEMRGGHNSGFVFADEAWVAQLAAFLAAHAAAPAEK